MEGRTSVPHDERANDSSPTSAPVDDVKISSIDELTIEKIVTKNPASLHVFPTKNVSLKKFEKTLESPKIPEPNAKSPIFQKRSISTEELSSSLNSQKFKTIESSIDERKFSEAKKFTKLPIFVARKSLSASSLIEKRKNSQKILKNLSSTNFSRINRNVKFSSLKKIRKIPPKVPAKPANKKKHIDVPYFGPIVDDGKIHDETTKIVEKLSKIDETIVLIDSESRIQPRLHESVEFSSRKVDDEAAASNTRAHELLSKSHHEIQRLQKNLQTKINPSTAETYKQLLPSFHQNPQKSKFHGNLDHNDNVTKKNFDVEFLESQNFHENPKILKKQYLETDIDYASDIDKNGEIIANPQKPRYSKKVLEIEKRWSGEFLENHFDLNSSESSYVEELESVSSRESIDVGLKFFDRTISKRSSSPDRSNANESTEQFAIEENFEDTVSTVDSDSCLDDRFRAIDCEIDETAKSVTVDDVNLDNDDGSTIKPSKSFSSPKTIPIDETSTNISQKSDEESSINSLCPKTSKIDETILQNNEQSNSNASENLTKRQFTSKPNFVDVDKCDGSSTTDRSSEIESLRSTSPDGYASLIKKFTMDPSTSSKFSRDEKKKKSGFRRLLPGIFSPKDSRKDYTKKEQKERKKRDEKHFNQHQQNGIYSRSPDTMNLNEDITRNVKLDTSLNSAIIEERLNEIKQELFPDQGMTTSTPEHFLQTDRTINNDARGARSFTVNSSLSSIAPDDKWLDHNIISGSPDMRKFKQQMINENDRKCTIERKLSFQESNQTRFHRNHGPSGRTSAPPSERFLIRPRAVHPIDRPLPAIPQKVEFSNYQNHQEIRNHSNYFHGHKNSALAATTYPESSYRSTADNRTYDNHSGLYENGNHTIEKMEINRNQSIDSGFNLTPVSAQVKITRQMIVNQNQKAPLVGRTAKYSPSSSQKSGDYADSSYTPNSSQKSEFSPGSSKSGEYYLNSPRNSCRTSPNDSLNDRRDQSASYEDRHRETTDSTHSVPYPISPKINVHCNDDQRVYDDPPTSPLQEIRVDRTSRNVVNQNNVHEVTYGCQRASPNIPMSSNLAKLRANVENTTDIADSAMKIVDHGFHDVDKQSGSRITSPAASSRIIASPVEFRDPASPHRDDRDSSPMQIPIRVMSPSRIQRIASPLTILTPSNTAPLSNTMTSPVAVANANRSLSPPNPKSMTSPRNLSQTGNSPQNCQRRAPNQSRTPVPSPNTNSDRMTPSTGPYTPMSSFNPRRAQPNDQILIASPKRDATIYEIRQDRSSDKLEPGCPDSPIPMAESPCRVLTPRSLSLRHNVQDCERSSRTESPNVSSLMKDQQSPQRSSPLVRALSPSMDSKVNPQNIQRPEPIYVKRTGVQRALSPMSLECGAPRDQSHQSPVMFQPDGRPDTLLVPVRQDSCVQIRPATSNSRQTQQNSQQTQQRHSDGDTSTNDKIHVERRVQSPSATSRIHSQRPEVIYVRRDQNLLDGSSEMKRDVDCSVQSSNKICGRSPQRSNESNQSRQTLIGPDRGDRMCEDVYETRRVVKIRDSPMNEQLYGIRSSQQSPITVSGRSSVVSQSGRIDDNVAHDDSRSSSAKTYQQRQQSQQDRQTMSTSQKSTEPIYGDKHCPKLQDPIYGQRACESIYGQHANRQLSPSKRQMMQHLEAFYWQQKALDSQRKSIDSPPTINRTFNNPTMMDSPEVREAIYWQQLKKLDEEQQRKIYDENRMLERTSTLNREKPVDASRSVTVGNTTLHGSAPSLANQSLSLVNQKNPKQMQETNEDVYSRSKIERTKGQMTTGKPPMMGQKGQNQPVLVVRPQQAVRDANEKNPNAIYDEHDNANFTDNLPRSKSVSPHFNRGNERRSLSLPRKSDPTMESTNFRRNRDIRGSLNSARKTERTEPPIYEERNSEANKRSGPPPIFKRGSLISNSSSSGDYGTVGPKRVSFSNQSNSPEVGTGNWPTKHGMAPEPPTRKHRTEERTSCGTVVGDGPNFHGHEDNQNNCNNVYGNVESCGSVRTVSSTNAGRILMGERGGAICGTEYDAKPLPPTPSRVESTWTVKRSSSVKNDGNGGDLGTSRMEIQRAKVQPRKWPGVSESESGSEAGEVQRILHRRNEEEWNPGGKGRQSNDTGGSGRAEGEGGSNDLAGGRRGVLGGGRGSATSGSGGAGFRSRDEPRRHTLSGDHQPSLHHQQFNSQQLHPLHPHHLPPHGQYVSQPIRHTTMDLEMGTKSRQRKSPLPRGYPPPSSTMLFDDDPGIMSEVETSSTGFRRGGKQRSSLPVVRTPSKTLERPLGLVFLQYRNETKRALLPNEITSIDTVKALFVRSFPKQLTMEYLDSPHVKVYIHDSNKDMFYELEDLRSHLRDIRDRSVLRLFESTDGVAGMPGPMGAPAGGTGLPAHWEDQSYFSEPEFDSEFQHQHIHKSKTAKNSSSSSSGYYMGSSSTLPRGGPLMRAYSPAASSVGAGPNATPTQPKALGTPGGGGVVAPTKPIRSYQCGKSPLGSLGGSARFSRDSSVSLYSIPDRLHGESGYMSSPERGGGVGSGSGRYPGAPYSTGSSYEEPYYSQYSGTVTPVIDEEASDTELLDESYSRYGVKPPGRPPSGPPRSPFPPGAPALPPGQPYDVTRIRVEQMERQLANLTGLVQKALTHAPHTSPSPRDYLQVPAGRDPYTRTTGAGDEFDKHSSSSSASLPDDSYLRTDVKPPKLGKDKSVSFEKSVSFSDEPPDMNSPKQHSPQHAADTKPTKPAIKSSTLPRMSSQERDRHKPTPPPKPVALTAGQYVYRDLALTPEMYNQLRGLQKKANDLRQEVRNLRRMSQAQAHTVRETIRDTFITIRAMLVAGGEAAWAAGDTEKMRLSREEDLYKQETIRLEKDLVELESAVEELRSNVITLQTRVNMSEVENLALILSKSSKTVADLKVRFPSLQEGMKGLLSSEMEKVVREEEFLKNEPIRLENVLTRCKKLTGTLVTLKRLASVQEQRSPNAASVDAEDTPPITPTSAQHSKTTTPVPAERTVVGSASVVGGGSHVVDPSAPQQRPENALDALLDELQTFSRPSSQMSQSSQIQPTGNNHGPPTLAEMGRSASQIVHGRAPCMSDIGRKGSIDSSTSLAIITPVHGNTLRRLHSYPSSSDTDTSPPIARLQVTDGNNGAPQKPPVPERNAELLQLATSRRVPPPPPPRTSSRSPLASPTSPQLPPRNPTSGTLRRTRGPPKEGGKPPMALPTTVNDEQIPNSNNNMLSTSNSSSCESINSQEGVQNKKGRQEQLEQRHQELLRKQKALQEQYARLQQLQRNASGLTTVPPAPPDLLKKTGSESNLLAKMGLGMSTTSSGSLTSLTGKNNVDGQILSNNQGSTGINCDGQNNSGIVVNQTTTSKIYETDIL